MKKIKIENLNSKTIENQKTKYQIIPDENMCFQSKATKHNFIHTNGKEGLPLWVEESEIDLYEEVAIKGVDNG